jgi:hypothetical protein
MANTLAYCDTTTIMAVKCLIVQAPDSGKIIRFIFKGATIFSIMAFSITTLSITALSRMGLLATLRISDTQHTHSAQEYFVP